MEQLFHLRQFTRGEALQIMKKSSLTVCGFQEAWNNLRDRYENRRILVNSQLKVLFTFTLVKSQTVEDFKRLQRDITNSILALKMHNINISRDKQSKTRRGFLNGRI